MKNITEEVWFIVEKFLAGDKTEGDGVHLGLSGILTDSLLDELPPPLLERSELDEEHLEIPVPLNDGTGWLNYILNKKSEETREVFLDQAKECISLASEHGLIEVTAVDEDGDFVYTLTDKGQKLKKFLWRPEGAEEEIVHLYKKDEWMIEILKDMGIF